MSTKIQTKITRRSLVALCLTGVSGVYAQNSSRSVWVHPWFEDDISSTMFPNLPAGGFYGMQYLLHDSNFLFRNLLTYYIPGSILITDNDPVSYRTSRGEVRLCTMAGEYQRGLSLVPKSEFPYGSSSGTPQCVALIKTVANVYGLSTSAWIKGAKVSENTPKFTVVATFSGSQYSGHVGILVGSDDQGIVLVDQNYLFNGAIAQHRISWGTAGGYPLSVHGKNYYEVRAPYGQGGWLADFWYELSRYAGLFLKRKSPVFH